CGSASSSPSSPPRWLGRPQASDWPPPNASRMPTAVRSKSSPSPISARPSHWSCLSSGAARRRQPIMPELPATSPIKVLVVDDDAGVLRALATLFGRDAGFVCIAAQDPLEAVGIAEEEQPDVVLSDMRMPNMDGLGLLLQVKAKCPDSEVV